MADVRDEFSLQYGVRLFLRKFDIIPEELNSLFGWDCSDLSEFLNSNLPLNCAKETSLKLLLSVPKMILKLIEMKPHVLTDVKVNYISNVLTPNIEKSENMTAKWLVYADKDFWKLGKITFPTEDSAKEFALLESNESGQKHFIAKIYMVAVPPAYDSKLVELLN